MVLIHSEIVVPTPLGHSLSGLVISQDSIIENHKFIIFGPATAVKYTFYKPLATFFVEHGYTVLLFDYYGSGRSIDKSLRKIKITMAEWGSNDLQSVVTFSRQNYSIKELYYVGHSVGGQVLGLIENPNIFTKILLFSAQIGYWRYYQRNQKLYFLIYKIVFPVLISIFGYLPSKKLGIGMNLPPNQARQWAKWLLKKNYLFDDPEIDTTRYSFVKSKILSYSFSDDNWAHLEPCKAMVDHYANATITYVEIEPEKFGLKRIGHFGVFREKNKALFWNDFLDFFDN
jgi:predicted alpha/beta hydrolase